MSTLLDPVLFMYRHLVNRLRRLLLPSWARLDRQASGHACSLQAWMDIDDRNQWFPEAFRQRFGGFHPPGERREVLRELGGDAVRADMLALLLREIVVSKVPGALAELGVHQGLTARLIHHYCPERHFYLLDTFTGFRESDLKQETIPAGFNETPAFGDTSVEAVRKHIAPKSDALVFVPGWFPDSATDVMRASRFAFVHLDADLEAPIRAGLDFFWPRLNEGGIILVHDYNAWPGARVAVDEFRAENQVVAVPMPDKSGSVVLRKNEGPQRS